MQRHILWSIATTRFRLGGPPPDIFRNAHVAEIHQNFAGMDRRQQAAGGDIPEIHA